MAKSTISLVSVQKPTSNMPVLQRTEHVQDRDVSLAVHQTSVALSLGRPPAEPRKAAGEGGGGADQLRSRF